MRLIVDQGMPRDAAILLRERGQDCIHVSEWGMSMASDEAIIKLAVEQEATVLTLDADFHAILAVSGASAPSVIRIRLQGLSALMLTDLVQKIMADFTEQLLDGCLIAVKANKTTCHKLPIGGVTS